jgi:hypothetical protein
MDLGLREGDEVSAIDESNTDSSTDGRNEGIRLGISDGMELGLDDCDE